MTLHLPQLIEANIAQFTGRTWVLPKVLAWLEQSDERLLLLTGPPGTGKSMLVAWLAGEGPLPADPDARARLAPIRARVKAVHFCQANSGNTAPHAVAQSLAEQLARRLPGFADALAATLAEWGQPLVMQTVERVEAGGSVTGIAIAKLDLNGPGDEASFYRALRDPLKKLYDGGYDQPILLLIDALDEAATYTGSITIVQLLTKLADLPAQVRILATTRPDPRVRSLFPGVVPFDLIQDAPPDVDDVRRYAAERLAAPDAPRPSWLADLDAERRRRLADRLSQAARGNFLYAHLVLTDLLPGLSAPPDLDTQPFPRGLSGLYQEFLNRELGGARRPRWFRTFKPVLGLIAVAQGAGLTRTQIEDIARQEVEETLEACRQYLEGDWPDGPFRPFHQSLADFLLEDEGNTAYHIDARRMHRQIADYYWATYSHDWQGCDRYGLNRLATHLFESGQSERLLALISEDWMRSRYEGSGATYSDFLADVDRAWQAARGGGRVDRVAAVRLHMARQAVSERVSVYTDTDLETLVWLGRADQALDHARLRHEPIRKFQGLVTVYTALRQSEQLDSTLLDEAYDLAYTIPDDEQRGEALGALAGALAQAGRFEAAEAIAHSLQNDGGWRAWALRELAGALAQAGRFEAAEAIARSIQDGREQTRALRKLVDALIQVGRFEVAEAVARSLPNKRERARVLRKLVDALIQVGRFEAAEAVARSIQDERELAEALSTLVGALAQVGLFEAAEAVARSLPNDRLRAEALRELAGALGQVDDGRASGLFEAAAAVARSIQDERERARALRELVEALIQVGRFEAAAAVARSIRDERERAEALRKLAEALIQVGRFEKAIAVARSLRDGRERARALRELAGVLARAGDGQASSVFEAAEAVARSIQDDWERAWALRGLASGLAQGGRFEAAAAVARSIQDDELRAWALQELASVLAQGGHFKAAEAVAHSIPEDWLRTEALRELAGALIQVGRFEAAVAVARSIRDERERARALRELAEALARAGDSQASDIFETAEAVARSLPGEWQRARALRELAGALAKARRFEAAVAVARSIRDERERAEALRELAGALAKAGRFEKAVAIARSIRDERERAEALRELVGALAKAGRFAAAGAVARSLPNDERQAEALRELARGLIQVGRFEAAGAVARSLPNDERQAEALRELAEALARVGDGRTTVVFEAAVAVARSIRDERERARALRELAEALVRVGDGRASAVFADAEAVARSLPNDEQRAEALRPLADALAQAGRLDEALLTLSPPSLDASLEAVANWAPSFEDIAPGASLAVLREATRVAGWVRPDWRRISELLSSD